VVADSDDVMRYVVAIRVTCEQLTAELRRLRAALDSDAVLQPSQNVALAESLRRVGLAAQQAGIDPAAEL
jgi:hypothetical protein